MSRRQMPLPLDLAKPVAEDTLERCASKSATSVFRPRKLPLHWMLGKRRIFSTVETAATKSRQSEQSLFWPPQIAAAAAAAIVVVVDCLDS